MTVKGKPVETSSIRTPVADDNISTTVYITKTGDCYHSSGCGYLSPVSYTHLRAHETGRNLVCRLLLEKKKKNTNNKKK